jgi:hypothetical protein
MDSRSRSFVILLAFACVAATSLGLPTECVAVEIGVDASAVLQELDDTEAHAFRLSAPSAEGLSYSAVQTMRVGIEVSPKSQIEVRPGFSTTSSNLYGPPSETYTKLFLGVGYLRGHLHGASAAPFFRAGANMTLVREFSHTYTQFGVSAGGGLRWRIGKVLGLRSEIVPTRWFDGASTGRWDIALRGGLSIFTE